MGLPAPPAHHNAFGDPRLGTLYVWEQNHTEEQGGARIRAITNKQPTIARFRTVRAIRQQGTRSELVYKLAGTVPTAAQHAEFLRYMTLSLTQTIYFFHAAGEKFECWLTDYEPQRKYVARGPRGEHYIWIYTMQLDVLQLL